MDTWYPRAERNVATKTGGSFIDVPFRGVLHTTESSGFIPKSDSYGGWHESYPHFTVVERPTGITMYQHIPINTGARALRNAAGGVQTNRARAIQIEIVGRAAQSGAFSAAFLQVIAHWMRWVEAQTGVRRAAPKAFLGGEAHGENGAARMSETEWLAFNGWCGHQHVPENTHWDPGRIDINRLLSMGGGDLPEPLPPPEPAPTIDEVLHKVVNVDSGERLNVRSGPGTINEVIAQFEPGMTGVMATGDAARVKSAVWMEVRIDEDSTGWAHSRFLEADDQTASYRLRGIDEGDSLNVRAAPGTDADVVGSLEPGTTEINGTGSFERLGKSTWGQVSKDDISGWVNIRYLAVESAGQRDLPEPEPEMDPESHGAHELGDEDS